MKNFFLTLFLSLFTLSILALAIRGISGNPTEESLSDIKWTEDGPLELSPERGRFALLYSIVENGSFQFSLPIARFATPDVAYSNGKYMSLFAPGISFLIIPGFIIGNYFEIAQVGAFTVIAFFALLNVLLIRLIAIRLGAYPVAATIAGLTFLFATPAFAYAVSLYQHHVSTFLILLSLYCLLRFKGLLAVGIVWFLTAAALPIDNPNIVFMIPLCIYALGRLFIVEQLEESIRVKFKLLGPFTFVAALLPLVFFLWFNQVSHGDPFKLSGTLPTAKAIDAEGNPTTPESAKTENTQIYENPESRKKSASGFFNTRNLLNGFYVHFTSPDRGILYYTPVILFAVFGLGAFRKKDSVWLAVILGILGSIILLYSMWGDPWGGWAFGSRYLIPAYALSAILIALFLSKYKNPLFILLFLIVFNYSVAINTLGAITTNRNPPEGEAKALELVTNRQERYSYDRNYEFLLANRSKSFVFQTFFADSLSAYEYFVYIAATIIGFTSILVTYLMLRQQKAHYDI